MFRFLFETVIAYRYVDEGDCFNDERRGPGLTQSGITYLVEESWFSEEIERAPMTVLTSLPMRPRKSRISMSSQ